MALCSLTPCIPFFSFSNSLSQLFLAKWLFHRSNISCHRIAVGHGDTFVCSGLPYLRISAGLLSLWRGRMSCLHCLLSVRFTPIIYPFFNLLDSRLIVVYAENRVSRRNSTRAVRAQEDALWAEVRFQQLFENSRYRRVIDGGSACKGCRFDRFERILHQSSREIRLPLIATPLQLETTARPLLDKCKMCYEWDNASISEIHFISFDRMLSMMRRNSELNARPNPPHPSKISAGEYVRILWCFISRIVHVLLPFLHYFFQI